MQLHSRHMANMQLDFINLYVRYLVTIRLVQLGCLYTIPILHLQTLCSLTCTAIIIMFKVPVSVSYFAVLTLCVSFPFWDNVNVI